MLGKLIKYDFKAMSGSMLPIYAALLVLTLVFSMMVKFNFDQGFLFSIFAFLFIVALNGSIVACVFFVVTRFSRGLLKNEGYLSFALPVSTAMHILAKVINAIIWAFIEGLMLCLCMLIMGTVMGSIKEVAEFFSQVIEALGVIEMDVVLAVLKIIFIVILEMIASVCLIYAAMAVGHLFSRNQMRSSPRKAITTILGPVWAPIIDPTFPTMMFSKPKRSRIILTVSSASAGTFPWLTMIICRFSSFREPICSSI